MKTNNDLAFEPFVTFLATIPHDAELGALGETYAAAMEKSTTLKESTDADRAELAALDASLIDMPSNMAKLLSRRAELMQSLDVWPGVLAEAQRRRSLAHLHYLAALRRAALQEAHRANDALEPHRIAMQPMSRRLSQNDTMAAGRYVLTDEQRTAMLAELRTTHAAMAHDQAQLQLANDTVTFADARAQMAYGHTLKLAHEWTWAEGLARRDSLLNAPVVRSRVHS